MKQEVHDFFGPGIQHPKGDAAVTIQEKLNIPLHNLECRWCFNHVTSWLDRTFDTATTIWLSVRIVAIADLDSIIDFFMKVFNVLRFHPCLHVRHDFIGILT
jgi:hypothetical protein